MKKLKPKPSQYFVINSDPKKIRPKALKDKKSMDHKKALDDYEERQLMKELNEE